MKSLERNTNADAMYSPPDFAEETDEVIREYGRNKSRSYLFAAVTEAVSGMANKRDENDPPLVKDRYVLSREAVDRSIGSGFHPAERVEIVWPDVNYILVADNDTLRRRMESRDKEGDSEFRAGKTDSHRECFREVARDYGDRTEVRWRDTSDYVSVDELGREVVSEVDSLELVG